ncbi:hypothetical protein HMPREF9946_01879 [Acetobacteraceae bacterium AT-5844]|nr:hypothetical protein HMPREF9946_01879 [Acetobacteraceae bacterium AT-5844]
MMAITLVPVALAALVAAISFLSRSVSPDSAFHFMLARLPLYGYLGGGLLILTGWLASRQRGTGNAEFLQAIFLGWVIGLVLVLAAWWLGRGRAES